MRSREVIRFGTLPLPKGCPQFRYSRAQSQEYTASATDELDRTIGDSIIGANKRQLEADLIEIAGVFPPIATPFDIHGELDRAALRANVNRWNRTGLAGYVVAGSNGESAFLSDDEIETAIGIVREEALQGMRVIAGTGRESTRATIALTRRAAQAGADAVLVLTPSFYGAQMNVEALCHHFEAVADASPVPVLIYNVPKFTHLNIPVAAIERLSRHDNIIGLKDSAGNIGQIIDFLRVCPADFQILVGNAPAYLSALQVGATGGILALANVAPQECVRIWELVKQGQWGKAREIHFRLMPVGRAVTTTYGVPGLKAALDLLGYRGGPPRLPLLPLGEKEYEDLRNILSTAGLL